MTTNTQYFKAFTLMKNGTAGWIRFIPTNREDLISLKYTLADGKIQESLLERPRALKMMVDLYAVGYNDAKVPASI